MAARNRWTHVFGHFLWILALLLVLGWVLGPGVAWTQVSYNVMYRFTRGEDGASPGAPLIQGSDGNFYGTTAGGGTFDRGTVFKLTPTGAVSTLYTFTGAADGAYPHAGLLQATDGNFYGTTWQGTTAPSAYGVVFRLTPGGAFTTLYTFTRTDDGGEPHAALIEGIDGNLYGTTELGGTYDGGTVFKITPGGVLTTLYAFSRGSDGGQPEAALIQGDDGNFYGTTSQYGANGYGTAFKMTPAGILTTLHAFAGGADGAYPEAPLIKGADGNFYGTTSHGATSSYHGTVFKITPAGGLTTLHVFSDATDGAYPHAALLLANDGNFYGTTSFGGTSNWGTVFKMTPTGTLNILHSFAEAPDGAYPEAALIQATDGKLYGTTAYGGTSDYGAAFVVSAGLVPRAASVGTFRPTNGAFYLDYNWNGIWDGCGIDRCLSMGLNGDIALVGDWNGSGTAKVGTFRPSDGAFYLDYNGNGAWDGCGTDRCLSIGLNGDIPLVGDWNGSGTVKVGTFRPTNGAFYLDYNGNGQWDGCGMDRCLSMGLNGDTPLVGKW